MGKKKVAPPRVVIDTNVLVSALLFGGQPGNASYPVTGDRDLLTLQAFGNTRIVTARDLLGLL